MILFMLAFLCVLNTATSDVRNATVNEMFFEIVKKANYFTQKDVRLQTSVLHKPELPSWLTFLQRNDSSDALLYGTPSSLDTSVPLQIVALDVNSYTTVTDKWTIVIKPERDPVKYIAEFWVTNFNIDEILDDDLPTHFLNKVRRIWTDRIEVIKMAALTDPVYTGRQPVPQFLGGSVPKEGVAIQLGGPVAFTGDILNVSRQVRSQCPDLPSVAVNHLFSHMYTVDWCHLKLITRNGSRTSHSGQVIHSSFKPREQPITRREFTNEFLFVVILPIVLAFLLLLMLMYIMICHREGRQKREMDTSNHQLEQYSTIRLSTSNLRTMSLKRTGGIQANQSQSMYNSHTNQSQAADYTNSTRSATESDQDTLDHPPPIYNLPHALDNGANNGASTRMN